MASRSLTAAALLLILAVICCWHHDDQTITITSPEDNGVYRDTVEIIVDVADHDRLLLIHVNVDGRCSTFTQVPCRVTMSLRSEEDSVSHTVFARLHERDGDVAVSDTVRFFICSDGVIKWQYWIGRAVNSSPAVGPDGTVYVAGDCVYALSSDGQLKWKCSGIPYPAAPAIGIDGTIYVGGWDGLYALDPTGTIKWSYATSSAVVSPPALGADGTIYVGAGCLHAINPDGSPKWRMGHIFYAESSPAVASDGTIYLCGGD